MFYVSFMFGVNMGLFTVGEPVGRHDVFCSSASNLLGTLVISYLAGI